MDVIWTMGKLAIIGASYLQLPLIKKAKQMGYETHVFAWEVGDVGEKEADYFYPISIVEKKKILEKCIEIGISGICSISSDLAMVTVNYVAEKLGLVGNSIDSTLKSTNKYLMRQNLVNAGVPCPRFTLSDNISNFDSLELKYPIIVKPTDRSGSRGVTKLISNHGLRAAITAAKDVSFEKKVILEEYIDGKEYSIECISYKGKHTLLAITEKFTTGSPNYIETGHFEPGITDTKIKNRIQEIVYKALDSLGVENGASHTELKINDNENIAIVEIGARMGGDCIGSSLVELTTGIDFVKNVILVATGREPDLNVGKKYKASGICFIFDENDVAEYRKIRESHPELLVEEAIEELSDRMVTDSSTRFGYYILAGDCCNLIHEHIERACSRWKEKKNREGQ